jgi:hypothetical protein
VILADFTPAGAATEGVVMEPAAAVVAAPGKMIVGSLFVPLL